MTGTQGILVRSTRDQIADFKGSILWKDIKRELVLWKKRFQSEYDSVISQCINGEENSASVLTHLGDLHGRGAAIEYFLHLPDVFLQVLEAETEEKESIQKIEE